MNVKQMSGQLKIILDSNYDHESNVVGNRYKIRNDENRLAPEKKVT